MYHLVSYAIKIVLLLIFAKIIQVSTAPNQIVEIEDVPFLWCDEDYSIPDTVSDALKTDDAGDDLAFAEISYLNEDNFQTNL